MSGTVVQDAPRAPSWQLARTGVAPVPSADDLLTADPDQFVAAHTDIAAVNLACARGLPKCDESEFPKYLTLLDTIADAVRRHTDKSWRLFKLKPQQFHNSENVFRIYTMEHVFRVQFGIKYDPVVREITEGGNRWMTDDSSEVFIHGILSDKRTGTCSSLPTFAIAVGRRLGYPLKLVLVPNHTLYRWDDGKDVFNFQHTEAGADVRTDESFYTWPRKWDAIDFEINARTKVWLHSLTPRKEVSKFLCNRALMLRDIGRYSEALEALDAAARFDPINPAVEDIGRSVEYAMAGGDVAALIAGKVDPNFIGLTGSGPLVPPETDFHLSASFLTDEVISRDTASRLLMASRPQPKPQPQDLDAKLKEQWNFSEDYYQLVNLINESNRNRSPQHPHGNPANRTADAATEPTASKKGT